MAWEGTSFLSNKQPFIALNCREGGCRNALGRRKSQRYINSSPTEHGPKLCHSTSNTPPCIAYITPSLVLFLISRLNITYLLVSCRSSNKPRLVRDREVLHRILESITLLITIDIAVIPPLLLTRGDTIIIVRGFVFKVKLKTRDTTQSVIYTTKQRKDRLKGHVQDHR
jgi:hypothetical protein